MKGVIAPRKEKPSTTDKSEIKSDKPERTGAAEAADAARLAITPALSPAATFSAVFQCSEPRALASSSSNAYDSGLIVAASMSNWICSVTTILSAAAE